MTARPIRSLAWRTSTVDIHTAEEPEHENND
jgi:hypothetical protein